jgi:hypothetical protein
MYKVRGMEDVSLSAFRMHLQKSGRYIFQKCVLEGTGGCILEGWRMYLRGVEDVTN